MSTNVCWVLGPHAISALLATNPDRALELLVVENPHNAVQAQLLSTATEMGLAVQRLDKRALTKQVGSEQHQGVALSAIAKREGDEQQLLRHIGLLADRGSNQRPLILILDQVQDPHNYGACLRTADAAGVDAVIVAKDNASPLTAVVQKVACGAVETLNLFRVTNLARCIDALKDQGVWVIGTSDRAPQSIYQADLTVPLALVMGAEGKGIRTLTEKKCDSLVNLPMASSVVTSLNVSVATGVCLYEVVRQRNN